MAKKKKTLPNTPSKVRRWGKRVFLIIEFSVLIFGLYKLIAIKTDLTDSFQKHWEVSKEMYDAINKISPETAAKLIPQVAPTLNEMFGTYTSTCEFPAQNGKRAMKASFKSLEKINDIQLIYGGKTVACPKEYITHQKGELGRIEDMKRTSDAVDYILFGLAVLLFLKVLFPSLHN